MKICCLDIIWNDGRQIRRNFNDVERDLIDGQSPQKKLVLIILYYNQVKELMG